MLFWNELPNSKGATVPKKLLVYEIYYRGDEQRRSRYVVPATAEAVAEAVRYEIQRNIDQKLSARRSGI